MSLGQKKRKWGKDKITEICTVKLSWPWKMLSSSFNWTNSISFSRGKGLLKKVKWITVNLVSTRERITPYSAVYPAGYAEFWCSFETFEYTVFQLRSLDSSFPPRLIVVIFNTQSWEGRLFRISYPGLTSRSYKFYEQLPCSARCIGCIQDYMSGLVVERKVG